jgi:predicted nuclease with TOPRIM domain
MKSKIILKAEAELEDKQAREQLGMLWTKMETLNERTKRQTIQITELNKRVKELEGRNEIF